MAKSIGRDPVHRRLAHPLESRRLVGQSHYRVSDQVRGNQFRLHQSIGRRAVNELRYPANRPAEPRIVRDRKSGRKTVTCRPVLHHLRNSVHPTPRRNRSSGQYTMLHPLLVESHPSRSLVLGEIRWPTRTSRPHAENTTGHPPTLISRAACGSLHAPDLGIPDAFVLVGEV